MNLKLLFLFLCFVNISFCQERVLILGKVSGNSILLSDIHVYNTNSGKGTLTDKYGIFKMKVKLEDVLVFTSIQFSVVKRKITKKDIVNRKLHISIFAKINLLKEVIINSRNLTGSLLKDANNVPENFKKNNFFKLDLSKINFDTPIITEANARKPPNPLVDSQTAQMINLTGVFSLLTKGISRRIKAKQLHKKRLLQVPNKIRQELGDSFFIKELKISKPLIDDFLAYCMEKEVRFLYMQNKKIEMIEVLYDLSPIYLKGLE